MTQRIGFCQIRSILSSNKKWSRHHRQKDSYFYLVSENAIAVLLLSTATRLMLRASTLLFSHSAGLCPDISHLNILKQCGYQLTNACIQWRITQEKISNRMSMELCGYPIWYKAFHNKAVTVMYRWISSFRNKNDASFALHLVIESPFTANAWRFVMCIIRAKFATTPQASKLYELVNAADRPISTFSFCVLFCVEWTE